MKEMNSRERSSGFRLRTLGTAELRAAHEDDSEGAPLLGAGKPLALLVYCSTRRAREHSREALATLLWADSDATRARQSLRQAIWRLKRIVGDGIRTRDDAVLEIDDIIGSDREAFLDAVHRGDAATAIDLYGGPFLDGMALPGGDAFEDWMAIERRHLEDALLRVAEPYARRLVRDDRASQARAVVAHVVNVARENISAHKMAIEVSMDTDDRSSAMRYSDVLEVLISTIGGDTPPAIEALIARVRRPTVESVDVRPANVVFDLVGRDAAFADILGAWERARGEDAQVVIISGSAGIGKSRLLAAVSQRCAGRRSLTATVRANSGERDVPFGFAAAIARALSTLPGAAGVSAESARELVALDPGLASQYAVTPRLDDGRETTRRRALALLDLVDAIAEQAPLGLFLDDLHWSDPASSQVLSIVLGRARSLPVLVVATTRGTPPAILVEVVTRTIPLLPLTLDATIDAIRSAGNWPATDDAERFIDSLATASGGVPLDALERLALVLERGMLVLQSGDWSSPDWATATAAVAVASPLDQRLHACTPHERVALLTLAVSGTPLDEQMVLQTISGEFSRELNGSASAQPRVDAATSHAWLTALEVKGLALRSGIKWLPLHDVIAERVVAISESEDIRRAHQALAMTWAGSAHAEGAERAVRHHLKAEDDANAGSEFAHVVAGARRRGDGRHARDILADQIGEQLPPGRFDYVVGRVPFWNRHPLLLRRRILPLVTIVMAMFSVVWALNTIRRPVLTVVQSASRSVDVVGSQPTESRTLPSIVVALPVGARGESIGATYVRVRATTGATVIAGDSVPLVDGVAAFNALRFRRLHDTVTLRFEAAGLRAVDVTLSLRERASGPLDFEPRVGPVSAVINGEMLNVRAPVVRVRPSSRIHGTLQVEYTTIWPTSSVWLSMTPTWGDARTSGRELFPLITPVQRELVAVPVDVLAPVTPGHYWLLYVMAAEPSGMYALSRTNWTVGHPVWDDGNEVAGANDSTIRLANSAGFVNLPVALPRNWPASGRNCVAATTGSERDQVKMCDNLTAMFGIEIIVQ